MDERKAKSKLQLWCISYLIYHFVIIKDYQAIEGGLICDRDERTKLIRVFFNSSICGITLLCNAHQAVQEAKMDEHEVHSFTICHNFRVTWGQVWASCNSGKGNLPLALPLVSAVWERRIFLYFFIFSKRVVGMQFYWSPSPARPLCIL